MPILHGQRTIALIFALCSFAFPSAEALQTSLVLKRISRDIGLPANTVRAIEQDHNGIIWLGLESGGLAKYNGTEFFVFRTDANDPQTLPSDYVNAVLVDRSNRLWVGTESGLCRGEPNSNRFTRLPVPTLSSDSGYGENLILDIMEDRLGAIWIGTSDGVSRLDPGETRFRAIPFADGQGEVSESDRYQCNALYEDHTGAIWLATRNGMYVHNRERDRNEPSPDLRPGPRDSRAIEFFAVTEDLLGNLWFGHNLGLGHFDRSLGQYVELGLSAQFQDEEETNVGSLLTDERGRIWVGTFSDGLRIIDPATMQVTTQRADPFNPNGLLSNSIRALFEDRSGIVWIGTKFEGVFLYDRIIETFPFWKSSVEGDTGLRDDHVLSLVADKAGRVWIGTKRGGLSRFDRAANTFSSYYERPDVPGSIIDNRVEALFEDTDGALWLGTEKGLSRFFPDTETFENFPTFIVRDIARKDSRHLYVGTNYGLLLFDTESKAFLDFPVIDGIDISTKSAKEIKVLAFDPHGALFIGTHHSGLYRFDASTNALTRFVNDPKNPRSISSDMIRAFMVDSRGRYWVGTKSGGLNRYYPDTQTFTSITEAEGLPSNTVFGIAEDAKGQLWLTTDAGLANLVPERSSITNYNEDYGLQSNVFEPNAICVSATGEIYVGGDGGFNAFFPERIQKRFIFSSVSLSFFTISGQPVEPKFDENGRIVLDHTQNYLGFSFALADYSSPGQNLFRYQMIGIDPEPVMGGRRNYVSYTSLPPGNYRFVANGKSPSGDWSINPLELELVITPPLWRTAPFIAISSALLALAVIGTFMAITRAQRYRRASLQRQVEERTAELQSANLQLEEQSLRIRDQNTQLSLHQQNLEAMVNRRTKELEKAKIEAEESDRLKSSFLANMSHEIRTPMNAIIGFSSMLDRVNASEEERREFTRIIRSNGSALLKLIDDILDLSLIEAGEIRIAEQAFDLNELVLEIAASFSAQVVDRDRAKFRLRLAESVTPTPIRIITDPDRLRQILTNLISNAIKFTREGHVQLTYTFDPDKREVVFVVEDTGIGMEERHLQVIWDRFRKIEDDVTKIFRGTGLGLAITKNLVDLLGGRITVASQPRVGSTFTVALPIALPQTDVDRASPASSKSPDSRHEAKPINGHSLPTILVAEDEVSNFLLLSRYIPETRARVLHARDGEEAVKICERDPAAISLVLMDIKMPRMDGREAARRIKRFAPRLPIVANTAYAAPADRESFLAGDFDGYLSKPTTYDSVMETLKRFLH